MKEYNLETQKMRDAIRVFCVDCCAKAEILWLDRKPFTAAYLNAVAMRIRCHGRERFVLVPPIVTRVAERNPPERLDLLWSQLEDHPNLVGKMRQLLDQARYLREQPEQQAECREWAAQIRAVLVADGCIDPENQPEPIAFKPMPILPIDEGMTRYTYLERKPKKEPG